MTTANKVTILRILLIPFFVVELIYYLQTGNEIHRLLALLSFAVTAILDAVDAHECNTPPEDEATVMRAIKEAAWR